MSLRTSLRTLAVVGVVLLTACSSPKPAGDGASRSSEKTLEVINVKAAVLPKTQKPKAELEEPPAPEPGPVIKPHPKPSKPKPLRFGQRLRRVFNQARRSYKKGRFEDAYEVLDSCLAERYPSPEAMCALLAGDHPESLEQQAASLRTRAWIGHQLLVKNEPFQVPKKAARGMIQTEYGRSFPAWVLERYPGEAERDGQDPLTIVRLDAIRMQSPRHRVQFERLSEDRWRAEIDREVARQVYRLDFQFPPHAYKMALWALHGSALAQALQWFEKMLWCGGSEVLLIERGPADDSVFERMACELSALTGERSLISELNTAHMVLRSRRLKRPKRPRSPKASAQPEPKAPRPKPAEPEPVLGLGPEAKRILELAKLGRKAYHQAQRHKEAGRRDSEQVSLKTARQHFEKAVEAWNILEERDQRQAQMIEKDMEQVSVMLYDCVKRSGVHVPGRRG